ncbi:hypothetical protein ASE01_18650 [Nocardioides sp. Root190]|uniref:hypothetical protein n=1 Tax=Nocardioides sp. Root190 TaxID=1736488 RepID=UPI0006F589AA|nr:hypothetical protein [Nocardioides sp. Root190]KRB74016.1 hypothetical protein ASE01_18650 [Nocardioides sp. Root190]
MSLAVCLGLVAFSFAWSAWQASCYDDSDPSYYVGGIVLLLAAPGTLFGGFVAVLRMFGSARSDLWNVLSWLVVVLYLALAILVGLEVWSTRGDRVYCGGVSPYGD